MKLHEAKLLLNDPTFSIDSITYQELEMYIHIVAVHYLSGIRNGQRLCGCT